MGPRRRKGKLVVLHLAIRYPFAGVIWQLLHHLVGFRRLGFDTYYVEDNRAYVYDPVAQTPVAEAGPNLKRVVPVLERFGFADRWAFVDPVSREYIGLDRARCLELVREADAVINLCGATDPHQTELRPRCLVYLETDPGSFQAGLARGDPKTLDNAGAHQVFFTYGYNLGARDCLLPDGGLNWHPTRPPVLLDQWSESVEADAPAAFTTVGTWRNKGNDVELDGKRYHWSKHVNFAKVLEVAKRAGQAIELATDLHSGADYERALAGGFSFRPVVPMSLDVDAYRAYISGSRGEFTVAKDLYARTRSGWFSDRSACYLAAGRPVVTQRTGFEKFIPTGSGLLSFDDAEEAVEAIRMVNADYPRHRRAARALATEYFDSDRLLGEMAETLGL